jgi:hypothetical protein
MNQQERLNLKKLINEMDCHDNTENIRNLKHSHKIRDDITKLQKMKHNPEFYEMKRSQPQNFAEKCRNECSFLFTNYTDIFNKICKDELNLQIMYNLLEVLQTIEDGKVDQHEGSVVCGKLLKELYIDSAIRRGENLDKENIVEPVVYAEAKNISWKDYKKLI